MINNSTRARYIPGGATELQDCESSAVAYLYTHKGPKGDGLAAVMFSGKRSKPDSHYVYRDSERRDAAIQEHFARVRRAEAYRAERREANSRNRRKAAALDFEGQDYLSAADCAALLRRSLAESWPGVRFSVRSDHGSLVVKWTDGPALKAVDAVADRFEGSYFCGMEDYRGSNHHTLDGRRVRFGANFASCSRDVSTAHLRAGLAAWEVANPADVGALWIDESRTWGRVQHTPGADCLTNTIYHDVAIYGPPEPESGRVGHPLPLESALIAWADAARPVVQQESATLARVCLLGTDGYGRGGAGAAPGCENISADHGRAQLRAKRAADAEAAQAAELDALASRFGVSLSTVN